MQVSYSYDVWGNRSTKYHANTSTPTGLIEYVNQIYISILNPFGYRGYCFDGYTELYYLQSRYYDPNTGRFINADDTNYLNATGTVLGCNLFAYCENDAVNRVDAKGNLLSTIFDGVNAGRDVKQDIKDAKSDLRNHAKNVVNIGYFIAKKKGKYDYKYKKSYKMRLKYYSHCKSTYNVLLTYAEFLGINLSNKTWGKLTKKQRNDLLDLIGSWDYTITYNVARYYAGNRGAKLFMDSFVFG